MRSMPILVSISLWGTNLLAQTPPSVSSTSADADIVLPDSPARQHFKALSKDEAKVSIFGARKDQQATGQNLQNNAALTKFPVNENALRLEEIRVYGSADPEDYVAPKPAPMLVFRATLDKQRPRTPAEVLRIFCFLCPISAPSEGNIADRVDNRTREAPTQMRGTLQ